MCNMATFPRDGRCQTGAAITIVGAVMTITPAAMAIPRAVMAMARAVMTIARTTKATFRAANGLVGPASALVHERSAEAAEPVRCSGWVEIMNRGTGRRFAVVLGVLGAATLVLVWPRTTRAEEAPLP